MFDAMEIVAAVVAGLALGALTPLRLCSFLGHRDVEVPRFLAELAYRSIGQLHPGAVAVTCERCDRWRIIPAFVDEGGPYR
jgi:hypothetical protein